MGDMVHDMLVDRPPSPARMEYRSDKHARLVSFPILWIRIILVTWIRTGSASNKNQDPHQNEKLDPEPEPDPDPHQFADYKPKCMDYEPI
jgi:hypothetical protein